jgi:ribosomal protein L37AE/L43A
MDCVTWLALDKHKKKGCKEVLVVEEVPEPEELYRFYSRFEKTGDKCPKCLETFVDFWKMSDDLWVCMGCRNVFVPKAKMRTVVEYREKEVAKIREDQRRKAEAAGRV